MYMYISKIDSRPAPYPLTGNGTLEKAEIIPGKHSNTRMAVAFDPPPRPLHSVISAPLFQGGPPGSVGSEEAK
jgi:hypothetical protein